ncbi:MAG: hypothetical protein J5892_05345 [Bacilli bacterium]|nr:hypothetical protein [Bacilli bacterium]
MNNALSILNGISKTLDLTKKILPLVSTYKNDLIKIINLASNFKPNKKIDKKEIVKTKKEESKASTLTFFQ